MAATGHRRWLRTLVLVALVLGVYLWRQSTTEPPPPPAPADATALPAPSAPAPSAGAAAVARAFRDQRSGIVVELEGRVERLLRDDLEGSRHQRFILRVSDDQTLLISHNIDLAPRVPLEAGDRVSLRGQYEWNARGGVVHWTHHDPKARRPGGWIRHRDQVYR